LDDVEAAVRSVRRSAGTALGSGGASAVLGAGAIVLWIVTVRDAVVAHMGQIGLVSVLGRTYFVGLALAAVAFAIELLRERIHEGRLLALTIVLVLYLFGTACAIEPVASLTSSWVHAGYVQYVFAHGKPLENYNAEFSWPGSFSLGAVVISFMGQSNALDLLRWFPLVIELLYLAPLVAIARASGVSRRTQWLGIALFYATNWIYQDYFSPQAINFLFFLAVIAVVLTGWAPVQRAQADHVDRLRDRLGSWRSVASFERLRGADAATSWTANQVLGVFVVLSLLFLASAASHQLTPYAIFLALIACLASRRLGRPELIGVVFCLAVGWLSLGASNFWFGHLSLIFGSIGQLGSSIGSNVSNRVTGSASHRLIVDVRILITAALFGLAALGAARRAATSRTLELLVAAPFVLFAVQNYGGEGLLRVALLSGPFAALLAASAILPEREGPIRPILADVRLGRHPRALLGIAVGVVLFSFAVTTTVVRGGNDAYESFSTGELAAVNYVYAHIPAGKKLAIVAPYLPLGQRDVGAIKIYTATGNATTFVQLGKIRHRLIKVRASYVILNDAQKEWGLIVAGYKPGWQNALERALIRNDGYRVAFKSRDLTATVLFLAKGK
jgi:hypothetical protein